MKTTRANLSPATNKLERLKKYIKSSTPLERLAFACCVYVGVWEVILKIV